MTEEGKFKNGEDFPRISFQGIIDSLETIIPNLTRLKCSRIGKQQILCYQVHIFVISVQ